MQWAVAETKTQGIEGRVAVQVLEVIILSPLLSLLEAAIQHTRKIISQSKGTPK
jgi:hypothetical protein